MLDPPVGVELPSDGFDCEDSGYIEPVSYTHLTLPTILLV